MSFKTIQVFYCLMSWKCGLHDICMVLFFQESRMLGQYVVHGHKSKRNRALWVCMRFDLKTELGPCTSYPSHRTYSDCRGHGWRFKRVLTGSLTGGLIGAQFVKEHVRMADALEYLRDALRGYAALQIQQPAPSIGAACYTGAQLPLPIS